MASVDIEHLRLGELLVPSLLRFLVEALGEDEASGENRQRADQPANVERKEPIEEPTSVGRWVLPTHPVCHAFTIGEKERIRERSHDHADEKQRDVGKKERHEDCGNNQGETFVFGSASEFSCVLVHGWTPFGFEPELFWVGCRLNSSLWSLIYSQHPGVFLRFAPLREEHAWPRSLHLNSSRATGKWWH